MSLSFFLLFFYLVKFRTLAHTQMQGTYTIQKVLFPKQAFSCLKPWRWFHWLLFIYIIFFPSLLSVNILHSLNSALRIWLIAIVERLIFYYLDKSNVFDMWAIDPHVTLQFMNALIPQIHFQSAIRKTTGYCTTEIFTHSIHPITCKNVINFISYIINKK